MRKVKKAIAKAKKMVAKKDGKKLKTQIAIVLDRSGSMSACRKEAVDAFNEQVATIRKNSKKMDTRVSLFTFSTTPDEPTFFDVAVSNLRELTMDDYVPSGMTAMFDAVAKAVDKLIGLKESKDTAYLMVIISDGQENNSHEITREAIAAKIKALQDGKHWTFTYLGANQDLADISKHLGIPMGNTMAFVGTAAGYSGAAVSMVGATAAYLCARGTGLSSSSTFYDTTKVQSANDGTQPKVKATTK